ncbi:nucleotide pyrophosphohydrolase [Desulfurispira natronophila]|uniref:NTP pyrophosphatase (Non-canonical NTP hydrolase) n=1 Tax=Desulfurispira natronophila TaxID=682562 RepID=A0A7W7Y4J7_9BACT|nr:nucleotide pyrophosphohydrolase [Desulfurispira natronophila]MBB5021938.1 NTP pyrophosphatase (non-canonical NTP hydrolase) [Desulfurispira natronophila]
MSSPFTQLRDALDHFAIERDWDQFHSPKNLAMALTVEAAELQECFQWLTEAQSNKLDDQQLAAVRDEIADIQLYLIRLAGKLGVDIEPACWDKIKKNAKKYPAGRVKGSAKKYTHYQHGKYSPTNHNG